MNFRSLALALIAVFSLLTVTRTTSGQEALANSASLPPAEVDRIVKAFTAKEAEFRHALNEYSFKRDAILQSIGMGGQIVGEYHRVSTFTFDDQVWEPRNYDDYDGQITWRRALAMSRNLGTIHVGETIGFDKVAALWRKVGVGQPPLGRLRA